MVINKKPLISIITPSFNQGQFIEDTIQSVLEQTYPNIEHIIMDGGSTDNTLDILKKYKHLKWVSEPDSGQANAINKGFRSANGEIIAWLNSDDYYEKNVCHKVVESFEQNPAAGFVYGDITYITPEKQIVRKISGADINFENLVNNPDLVRQPSSFWRRELLDKVGFINEKLDLVMDYDLFLRFAKVSIFHYIPENISYYRVYEETKTLANLRLQVKEIIRTVKLHNGFVPLKLKKKLLVRYLSTYPIFKKLIRKN